LTRTGIYVDSPSSSLSPISCLKSWVFHLFLVYGSLFISN
jgi:hypothetical protein